jgi:hypothetical protein
MNITGIMNQRLLIQIITMENLEAEELMVLVVGLKLGLLGQILVKYLMLLELLMLMIVMVHTQFNIIDK